MISSMGDFVSAVSCRALRVADISVRRCGGCVLRGGWCSCSASVLLRSANPYVKDDAGAEEKKAFMYVS